MSDLCEITVDQRFVIIQGEERRLAVQEAQPYSRTLNVVITRGSKAAMIEHVDTMTLGILRLRSDLLDPLEDVEGDSVAFLDSITDAEYLTLVRTRVARSPGAKLDDDGQVRVSKYAGKFENVLSWD